MRILRNPITWIVVVWALSVVALIYKTVPVSGDGIYYYAWLRSVIVDGDVDFLNELAAFRDNPHVARQLDSGVTTPTGLTPNLFSVGPAIVWAPVWLVARFFRIELLAPSIATSLYGLAGLLLTYAIVRNILQRFTSDAAEKNVTDKRARWIAFAATIATLLGTNLAYYLTFETSLAHGVGFFAVALLIYLWLRWRTDPGYWRWLVLGVVGGLVGTVRWQLLLVVVALVGVDLLTQLAGASRQRAWSTVGRPIARLALVTVGAIAGFAPQLAGWWALYGSPLVIPQGAGFIDLRSPHALEVLFSNRHGLLTWTPLVALALAGLSATFVVALIRRNTSRIVGPLLLAVATQLYINGTAIEWWGGDAFGARRFTDVSAMWAIGLGFLGAWAVARRVRAIVVGLLVVLLIVGNLALMQLYRLDRISRSEPITAPQLLDALRT